MSCSFCPTEQKADINVRQTDYSYQIDERLVFIMDYKFSDKVSKLQASAIREILKFTADPEVISFAAGNPAPEAFPKERIAEMTMRYQLCRDVLSQVFSERQTALNAHYATLDKALGANDRELIIASLKGISSIVETNPLESFKEFTKVLDNKEETLYLDF